MEISMTVNGRKVSADVEPRTLLVHFIREDLRLTGTHVGCETGYCGACTVHVDGKAVKSCTMFAVQADGATIKTIEGLAKDGELHPVQEGFWECHGLQCGYCTPGMILAGAQLLQRNPKPTREDIALPGMLHVALLRSPYAHARINRIETDAAKALAGVVAVCTGAEVNDQC